MNLSPVPNSVSRLTLPATRAETILVVDDQPDLRDVIAAFLQEAGYRVLIADGAEQAMQIAREDRSIDLLLTDVEMPGITGDELGTWFRIIRPQVQVVLMSANPMQGLRLAGSHFIEKPFPSLAFLAGNLRSVLAHGRAIRSAVSAAA